MIFQFSDDELVYLWDLAEKRQNAKRGTSARDRRTDRSINNVEMHYIGLKGEYAVATILGCEVDTRAYVAGDRTHDLQIGDTSIEVKTLQDWLVFNPATDDRCMRADVAVLVNPSGFTPDPYIKRSRSHSRRDVRIRGWTDYETFMQSHFLYNFGYGWRLCMQPDLLSPISSLIPIEVVR